MRLTSVVVRNYRVHRETRVDFAPGITLIHGPNESGKSTLVEAVHRALFLRSRGGGRVVDEMASAWGGVPEVELTCCFGDQKCSVRKSFRGARGQTTLALAGEVALTGDAADERLAQRLHVAAPIGGGGAPKLLAERWAHLWVWQGHSCENPAGEVADQREALLQRLQSQGGGAVMQSAFDGQIVAELRRRHGEIFTETAGRYKVGSEVARAQAAATEAAAAAEAAARTLADLEDACNRYALAIKTHDERQKGLGEAEAELTDAEGRLRQAEEVEQRLATGRRRRDELRPEREGLQKVARELDEARNARDDLAKKMAGMTAAVEAERASWEALRAEADAAEQAWREARASFEKAGRLRNALADHLAALQAAKELARLKTEHKSIEDKRRTLKEQREGLATIPAVSDDNVKALRKLEKALDSAQATLAALGAQIELIKSSLPVSVGRVALTAGKVHTITDDAELTVGDHTRLRIRPGSSAGLAEARQAVDKARAALTARLGQLAVSTLDEAVSANERRRALALGIEALGTQLAELGEDSIDQRVRTAAAAAVETARKANFAAAADGINLPPELDEARADRDRADSELSKVTKAEKQAAKAFEIARAARDRQAESLAAAGKAVADLKENRQRQEARISALVEAHGSDADREKQARDLEDEVSRLNREIAADELDLAGRQPELLRQDIERLRKVIDSAEGAMAAALQEQAAARERLRLGGTTDPHAELAAAKARRDQAQARFAEFQAQAHALQHLVRLADETRRAMAVRFTQPLADAVQGYLECIFGRGATIRITWNPTSGEFDELEVVRDPAGLGTFEFKALSGGTREQVGVAMRLAMAQVLAADHDGCLPVVLDDAFANSDPDRIAALQRMLYLAARNGLQIIVLTCTPRDYHGLGATEVELRPPAAAPGTPDPALAG